MEGRLPARALAGAVVAVVISAPPAIAYEGTVEAGTRRSGVELTFTRRDGRLAISVRSSRGSSDCVWGLQPYAEDHTPLGNVAVAPSRPNAESRLYLITCNGVFDRAQWIGPQNTVDIDALAADLAEQEIRRVTVVPLTIGINPVQGLTGVESWFWTEGYTGAPIDSSVGAFGITVGVHIEPSSVTWDFGDGSPTVTGDFGRPYPERSTVRHGYTHRSANGPYTVTATFEFRPTFSIDGGPPTALPPISRSFSTQYNVREAQAVGR